MQDWEFLISPRILVENASEYIKHWAALEDCTLDEIAGMMVTWAQCNT